MKNTIVDAGPLIALFDSSDKHHRKVLNFLAKYKDKLVTTWPVITETSYFLNYNVNTQIDFYKWIYLGGIEIFELERRHLDRIIVMTEKYKDVPMDFADASLIVLAEEYKLNKIISIDSDFDIYRTLKKEIVTNILA